MADNPVAKPQALGVMQFNFTADFDVNVPAPEQNEMIREQVIAMLDQIPGLKVARNTVTVVVQIPREGYRVVPRIVEKDQADQQPK